MTHFSGQSIVEVPSITSSIFYPYSEKFKEAYVKHFNTDIEFIDGMNKMLIEMIKTRKDYFVLLPQYSKTGRMVYFKFDIKVGAPSKNETGPIRYLYDFEKCYEV
ncbi:hypothetical protein DOK76_12475 [Vagococcus sp. DIV0080]|uniref:Uncharacterized protein n=1 Tax=Candidatus Vagococcus giribetii TaxID=2230876 RepID=A0ABS3HVX2_9ENTE|nr:DUF5960 family protein [Vagococcus sp. DIV0080]MBO0477889.1 hypothetical protein [Vagococcus sp. DIV0080]